MDKNIKYLIEDIINFNPADYNDDDIVSYNNLNGILFKYHPKTRKELLDLVKKRILEKVKEAE